VTKGGDGGLERSGGIALRLAGGVERGDLREDGLKASSCELGHRALEGKDATSEGQRLGVGVLGVGHGGKLLALKRVNAGDVDVLEVVDGFLKCVKPLFANFVALIRAGEESQVVTGRQQIINESTQVRVLVS